MKIVYYANDGTEFETQSQCEAYEKEQEDARKNFTSHFYDYDGDEISLEEVMDNNTDYHLIDYFDIKTEKDLQIIHDVLFDQCGITVPDDVGRWYYDYDKDKWCNYEDYKGRYIFMSEIFEGKWK